MFILEMVTFYPSFCILKIVLILTVEFDNESEYKHIHIRSVQKFKICVICHSY